mgnify:CR=1 FL=1
MATESAMSAEPSEAYVRGPRCVRSGPTSTGVMPDMKARRLKPCTTVYGLQLGHSPCTGSMKRLKHAALPSATVATLIDAGITNHRP